MPHEEPKKPHRKTLNVEPKKTKRKKMIKDIDTITNPTTTTTTINTTTTTSSVIINARTADSPSSSQTPANANANADMLAETQHESQPESQTQTQPQAAQPQAEQTPERCQEEPPTAQQEQQQEEEQLEQHQEARPEERAAAAACSNGGDRRDSITEEITITTTTINSSLSSKLLTIQEAEHSSISISSTSSKQNTSTAATNSTAAAVSTAGTVAAATVATAVAAAAAAASGSQQRNESSAATSSTTNGINSGSNPSLAQATSSSNTNLANSSSAPTPSINIVASDQASRDQPLQSQSVDSNGCVQPAGSCTDSPSSRKSSTSSKGRASQPKLSTSSSGRDEDTAQSKLNELTPHELSILRVDRGSSEQQQVSSSSNSNEKSAKPSRLSERAKKKSWYNVIYPNYKSRAEDFKKLFKDVPNDERLIVDYSCALQRDILVQGRLYVSQNYVCFHANIFSWETYVSIKWKDVTAITKEKTALVIPNAISIASGKDKYFFATFTSRDKSFLMLFRVWQNTLMNKPFSPQEIWKYVHNCYGEELGLTTDDEDYCDPTLYKDTETDVDFHTALDDDQSNQSQQLQQPLQRLSGNSSASSGGSGRAAAPRKSKTKYFFNSSKSSNSANASASGSDNNKDSARKLSKKMKQNAKELTLSSVKPAEQSVGVTMMNVPGSGSAGSSTRNSTESTAAATAAASGTASTNNSSGSVTATASGSDKKSAEKKNSTSSNSGAAAAAAAAAAATAAAASLSASSDAKHVAAESKRKMSKNHRQREAEMVSKNAEEQAPTDVSDSSDSEENNVPFVPTTECTSTHEGRQIVHTILPISVDTLFNLLFTKSKFLTDFHALRKSTDLTMGEWTKNEEGLSVRTVNVTVQLAASVGPKTSKVTEYQTMRACSKPGELYSIDVNSVNAGIPYADSFSVLIHFCLARTVDDNTMLSIHTQIKYKKSIWGVVKGFIEKNTWAGVEDFFGAQLHALQSETCIPPAKAKGRRPRRGIIQQSTTTAGGTALAKVTTTVTETGTGTATSTDNESIREPSRHHYHHHHQSEQHEHHQHQHLHMHHHHHHHHSSSNRGSQQSQPQQQSQQQHQQTQSQRPHHHHQHLHQHHQHTQPLWHHRKAIFQSSKGTATQIRPLEEAAGGVGVGGSGTAQAGIGGDTLLESHLLSAGGVAGSGAVGAASGHALLHEHGKLQQLSGLQQQQHHQHHHQQQHLQKHLGGVDLGGVGRLPLAMGQGQGDYRFLKHKGLSLFVILLLCLMLALNVILLLKLWKLEERIDVDLSRRASFPSLAALKELPNTNEEWLELLRQQEQSHESELRKWHQVLQTAIELLKKTEKTLADVIVR
ncbi:serine-rich adhesin for platelets [Drosophila madeirensis]|uniref:Serine-rich adhesin for platelets n=1 Tax=Drosophila madeirensis TaxID=30013 RepID=A0AAU9FJY4_DROMD